MRNAPNHNTAAINKKMASERGSARISLRGRLENARE
jgi:hypothetical protein